MKNKTQNNRQTVRRSKSQELRNINAQTPTTFSDRAPEKPMKQVKHPQGLTSNPYLNKPVGRKE